MVSDERPSPEGPATFREVFAQREYRAVFAASTLTWLGDYVARAAVTLLVYRETESVALSAAAFAVSYLPWLVGGPLLATIAERHRFRQVMVVCDLVRMALMLLVAVPGMPVPVILALLFATTLANPPSQAARSALLPLILPGDRLVVGLSVNGSVGQAAQVVGYLLGAAVATVSPTAALLMNAGAFALSALLVRLGVRDRPPAMSSAHRSHLLRETAAGFRMVFQTPVLRAIAVLVFSAMLFSIVPEGLAAAWANEHAGENMDPGLAQAVIMAATPAGFILGGLIIGRAVAPARRLLLLRPLAVIAPLALVPSLLDPPPIVVALLAALCGFAVAGLLPTANGLFVQALPDGFRARAFGVMATGVQVIQGAAVLVTGLLAERFPIPLVVGLWSLAGVMLMSLVALRWPDQQTVAASVETARAASTATDGTMGPARGPQDGSSDDPGPGHVGPGRPRHAVT
ncbi:MULTISPECIES: MFS transporter [unclassified Micromonospora]|uniref:MFS transporter n=1 Tax=unclassified Micromonospora TaxID=2617518 RepID=UPI0022B6AF0B|nr:MULTISPECIES: MFS transporter [unclassified Micromonospora]MCZ7418582.1 MFS transporter [Verrucosispora sp. WMMA2121]WBB92293.1 MFS transporter [Verrucosispora sp. WMMC514]